MRGDVPPAAFVPLAEATGAMAPLGRWVLTAACAAVAQWDRSGLPPLTLSVNLSPRQLDDPALVETVAAALAAHDLAPSRLLLEITEGAMLDDGDAVRTTLAALKRTGVRLAVDDFGTGYSSLAYLRRFPVDVVKIDRSFIAGMERSAADRTLVCAIVDLARALGLAAVAEGIETDAQVETLRSIGCTGGQGYLFARPAPADAIAARLRNAARAPVAVTPAA